MAAHAISPEGAVYHFPLPSPAQQPANDSAAVPGNEHENETRPLHLPGLSLTCKASFAWLFSLPFVG